MRQVRFLTGARRWPPATSLAPSPEAPKIDPVDSTPQSTSAFAGQDDLLLRDPPLPPGFELPDVKNLNLCFRTRSPRRPS